MRAWQWQNNVRGAGCRDGHEKRLMFTTVHQEQKGSCGPETTPRSMPRGTGEHGFRAGRAWPARLGIRISTPGLVLVLKGVDKQDSIGKLWLQSAS